MTRDHASGQSGGEPAAPTPPRTVFDALLLPALNYAERDRLALRLTSDEEAAVLEATRELLADVADAARRARPPQAPATGEPGAAEPDPGARAAARPPLRVLGYAANGVADELALAMLTQLVDDLPLTIEVTTTRMLASDVVALVQAQGISVVCIADLPPSPPSKTRYLIKRLHAAAPDVKILVGRWAPPGLADDSTQALRDAGATTVVATLADARAYLSDLSTV